MKVVALALVLSCALTARASAQDPLINAERAFTYYGREPTIDVVVAAAARQASVDPARARTLASRARMSGWIPTARLGMRRGIGQDLYAYQGAEIDRTNYSTANQLAFEALLYFRLDRLMFAREEGNLLREERALVAQRNELLRGVVHIYFERRRMQLERDMAGSEDLEHAMRIAEATALLDAFTGGVFSRRSVVHEDD
ncbi:MAG: hypothetical protein IPK60_10935 [Sandaracinaceae bacterium]|nr:hypothetical protein [Sandaracinaceae bacterium]